MEVELAPTPSCAILRIKGDLRLWAQPEPHERLLRGYAGLLEKPVPEVVLNIGEVVYIDTTGISALIRILKECTARNMRVRVVMPRGTTGEALRMVHIFDGCPQHFDEQEAARAAVA